MNIEQLDKRTKVLAEELHKFYRAASKVLSTKSWRIITDEWLWEDELPSGYPYHEMYPHSRLGSDNLGGARVFPKVVPSAKNHPSHDHGWDHCNKKAYFRKRAEMLREVYKP